MVCSRWSVEPALLIGLVLHAVRPARATTAAPATARRIVALFLFMSSGCLPPTCLASVPARNRYPCRHGTCLCERSTGTRTVAAHRKRWPSPVMKARGRAASLAFPAVPALMAAAVLAVGVPMVRLAASYPDTAPGGGALWQVALQAAAAVGAVAAGAALGAPRAGPR